MIDEWTVKENFILACCVARNGDQNWVSVSRNMKLITEACGEARSKHPDFFAQKNCAQRYNQLLGTALTSKRKSRSSVDSTNIETPAEQVYRKLTFANIEELNDTIQREREIFMKLKNDMLRIQDGEMDEKIFDMWNSIQSGEAVPLENLIPDENPPSKKETVDNLKTLSSRSERISFNASPSSCNTASRPQRQTKETEKFKSYIEQRQKHNAKYHHHQPSTTTTTIASPVTPMTAVKMAQSPVSTSHILPIVTTQPAFTVSATSTATMSGFISSSLKSSPLQMQRIISKTENTATSKQSHSPGLLILKTDIQRSSTLMSPTTTVRKSSDSRDAPVVPSSFLSSLLATPATDIKAQVSKITEVLKEPAEKRSDSHHVTDEAYKAYRKAQPSKPAVSPGKSEAPALAKLLEVVTSSNNSSPQISLDGTTSKPFLSPIQSVSTKLTAKQQNTPLQIMQLTSKDETTKAISQPMSVYKETKKVVDEKTATTNPSVERTTTHEIKASVNESITVLKLSLNDEESRDKPLDIITSAKEIKDPSEQGLTSDAPTLIEEKNEEKDESNENQDIREDIEAAVSLTIDIGETKGHKKEVDSEPPPKKRTIDVVEITAAVTEVVATPAKLFKGKKKGRQSRGGRKKTLSGSLKIDFLLEDPDKSDLEIETCGDIESDDTFERKIKAPITPSICSSPASPALSTGSNCDPDQAQQQRAWRKSIMLVWKAAASHKYANVFLHPVTDEEAPGYSSIIFRPMDLSLIKKNIETGLIATTTEFQRDIMLMFQNALMYNRKEHDVYRMAQEMRDDVMEQIQSFISTQLMLQTSGDRDAKNLRTKAESLGHTRQSSKSSVTFLSL